MPTDTANAINTVVMEKLGVIVPVAPNSLMMPELAAKNVSPSGQQIANHDAQNAASDAQRRGLGQKLRGNIATTGA